MRLLRMIALLTILTTGCRSEGTRELTIKAFGMEFAVIDKTVPNSEGKDKYEMGLTVGGLAILQSIIDERREDERGDVAP